MQGHSAPRQASTSSVKTKQKPVTNVPLFIGWKFNVINFECNEHKKKQLPTFAQVELVQKVGNKLTYIGESYFQCMFARAKY